jgi:hypothetical protein
MLLHRLCHPLTLSHSFLIKDARDDLQKERLKA